MFDIDNMIPNINPKTGIIVLYLHGHQQNLTKNYLKILKNCLPPQLKPSIGDLNICLRNIYLLD